MDNKLTTLWEMKEGDLLRFPFDPETRVRTLCQKGKIEGYCPYDGQNTMGHSKAGGEEVYTLDTKVIPIVRQDNKLLCTDGNWELDDSSVNGISLWADSERDNGTVIATIHTESPQYANDAHLIAASKDLYNGHLKHLEEIHKLLHTYATSDKIGLPEFKNLIGAIGENCEKLIRKANPNYKP